MRLARKLWTKGGSGTLRLPFAARVALTWGVLTLIALAVRVKPWWRQTGEAFYERAGLPPSEAAFLWGFTGEAWSLGAGIVVVLWLVVRLEKPADWRAFFTLDRTDWRGFWVLFGLRSLISGVEIWFLQRVLWGPVQDWLLRLGAWTEPALSLPPREYLVLNLAALVLMSWLEMAEEVYFRGYLQRQFTMRLGAVRGILLTQLLWDVWHVWNPAMFVRRFLITLPDAIVVHRRQRVWPSLIAHPLGNRLGVVLALLGSR